MNKTATIILNRNLPKETDKLVEHLKKYDNSYTDIFVIEAGSEEKNLSKYFTWYVNSDEVMKNGLRYARGMNYGLLQLWKENKWEKYKSFFLITNDTMLPAGQETIKTLQSLFVNHPRVGLISPCSEKWGERELIGENSTKYFWFIHNNAYFLRREFVEQIINKNDPSYIDFLFDGSNFRGYLSESEVIAKAYANDWAAAITTKVFSEEDESYLLEKSNLIRTESYNENFKLYIDEGLKWAHKKYGFNSRWQMMQYVKLFYDKFFEYYPDSKRFKI
jgi:hypothetical protein